MKRVPLDFDWPQGRVWKGFLNPYEGCKCPWCYDEELRGSYGYTREARAYEKTWYGLYCGQYVANPYHPGRQYCPQSKPYAMERWEYDFIVADDKRLRQQFFGCDKSEVPPYDELKEWLLRNGLFHRYDAIFVSMMIDEYCRRKGYESTCPHCGGSGLV